jgi:hypothetical protein
VSETIAFRGGDSAIWLSSGVPETEADAWFLVMSRASTISCWRFAVTVSFFSCSKRWSNCFVRPLVDAFIEVNRAVPARKSLVIVLTDFYPYSSCYSDMVTEMDWGSELTGKYLDGTETGATLSALTSVLSGISTQPNARGLEKFRDAGVFLWNFFPFFRGGSYHSVMQDSQKLLNGLRQHGIGWIVSLDAWIRTP